MYFRPLCPSCGCCGSCSPLLAAEQPNLVFFLADDLGWADLGCYGSTFYETPNLDRLAKQGMRFTDAYAACTSARRPASILTGKYPTPAPPHRLATQAARFRQPPMSFDRPDFLGHLPRGETTIGRAQGPLAMGRPLSANGTSAGLSIFLQAGLRREYRRLRAGVSAVLFQPYRNPPSPTARSANTSPTGSQTRR